MDQGEENRPKRGRPRLIAPEKERIYRGLWGPATRRTYQNRRWQARAVAILLPDGEPQDPRLTFLCDMEGQLAGKPRTHKYTILTELGRVADPEVMRALAEHICEQKLPTARAVALVRRARLGDSAPDPDRLVDSLLTVVNDHMARYPYTRDADVLAALDCVGAIVAGD